MNTVELNILKTLREETQALKIIDIIMIIYTIFSFIMIIRNYLSSKKMMDKIDKILYQCRMNY